MTREDRLAHISVKIERASETKKAVDAEIAAFLATKPYEVRSEFNAEERKRTYRVKKLAAPNTRIGIMAGEVIGHLRSVLDHVVWAIAPADAREFPIFADKNAYRERGRWKIRDLPTDAKKIIDACQPFNAERPTFEALWVLHRLANIDKHRVITLLLASPGWVTVTDPNFGKPDALSMGSSIGPFENEADTAWVHGPNLQADMEVNIEFTFQLILDFERRPLTVGPAIDWFYDTVMGVIRQLDEFVR